MGTFTTTTPAELVLAPWEAADRARAIAASGSPSPSPFAPIPSPPAVYTHVGRDAQYGAGRRNGRTARLLILHTTEGDSFTGSLSYGARRTDTVSATAYAGANGELGYTVPETDRPFTTGRWNDESLTLEICGRAAWTADQWHARPRQLEAIVRLLVDWCTRYSIPARWLDPAAIAAGASREGTTPRQGHTAGICDHRAANDAAIELGGSPAKYSHTDIGAGLRTIVRDELIPAVAWRLANITDPDPTPAPPTPPTTPPTWRPPMTALHMLEPELRLVDTRTGLGLNRPAADSSFEVELPADHAPTAAVVTVTVVGARGAGYLALWGDRPGESSKLNYAPGDPSPQANTTLVAVGRNTAGRPVVRGALRNASAELIIDLVAVIA